MCFSYFSGLKKLYPCLYSSAYRYRSLPSAIVCPFEPGRCFGLLHGLRGETSIMSYPMPLIEGIILGLHSPRLQPRVTPQTDTIRSEGLTTHIIPLPMFNCKADLSSAFVHFTHSPFTLSGLPLTASLTLSNASFLAPACAPLLTSHPPTALY